jgi:hypothetical protein
MVPVCLRAGLSVRLRKAVPRSSLRSLRSLHSATVYTPSVDDLAQLRKDRQEYEDANSNGAAASLLDTNAKQTSFTESSAAAETQFSPAATTSRLHSHRMTKTSDYLWTLRQNLQQSSDVSPSFIGRRFSQLENAMYAVNDVENSSLITLDVKASNNTLKELGVAIYDAEENRSASAPLITNHHIIVEEFHGVLSSNNFHGTSHVLPLEEAKKFLAAIMMKYFPAIYEEAEVQLNETSAKVVGFHVPQLLATLEKLGIALPQQEGSAIDIHDIYSLPFHYNVKLSEQAILRFPRFFQLETILNRLNLPHSHLINCGNSAYYQLLALLTMTDPYHRIKFKLDNVLGNFEFMEYFLVNQLDELLRQSERSKANPADVTVSGYEESQRSISLPFSDHEGALLRTFEK